MVFDLVLCSFLGLRLFDGGVTFSLITGPRMGSFISLRATDMTGDYDELAGGLVVAWLFLSLLFSF